MRLRLPTFLVTFAIILATCGITSMFGILDAGLWLTDRDWTLLHFHDGRIRVFWIRTPPNAVNIVSYDTNPHLRITPRPPGSDPAPSNDSEPPSSMKPSDVRITLGSSWQVDPFGLQFGFERPLPNGNAKNPPTIIRVSYFRLPIWLPVLLLLAYPIRATLRGPILERRRHRRNQCPNCGYNLMGLTEPRCPECGSPCDT